MCQRHPHTLTEARINNRADAVRFLLLRTQFVAPFGAYEALLGTNPIAVGIPREEGKAPVVLDMATAAFPCESHSCHRMTAGLACLRVFCLCCKGFWLGFADCTAIRTGSLYLRTEKLNSPGGGGQTLPRRENKTGACRGKESVRM